ncbi:MAG: type II secretion system protein [Patescibacteria group bacterium]|jgi:prepilin-type N-terminal cleavage/methylation domain-containing protein
MKFLVLKIKPGFTLIEVITVLFIISLALVGVLTLIVQSIQSQSLNKNNLIAYQLAQEGIELIRKTRDSNWRQGEDWDKDLTVGTYYMDYRDTIPHKLHNMVEGKLKQDADGFYYHHNEDTVDPDSRFTRVITLAKLNWGLFWQYGYYVRSQITWSENGRNYTYDLETLIYGWK